MPSALDPDEIIPPGRHPTRPARSGGAARDPRGVLSAFLAKWLDDLLRIPGTNIKVGLDPLIALLPGFGSAAATTAGGAILLSAIQNRAPVKLLGRMAGNMAVNAVLDAIPGIGPALSVWWRSNSRNNDLLQKHLAGHSGPPATVQTKMLVLGLLVFLVLVLALNIALWLGLLALLKHLFSSN